MKILIIIFCLVLVATQYPPVKSFINEQIQNFDYKLDSKEQESQQKQDAVKTQLMKQAE